MNLVTEIRRLRSVLNDPFVPIQRHRTQVLRGHPIEVLAIDLDECIERLVPLMARWRWIDTLERSYSAQIREVRLVEMECLEMQMEPIEAQMVRLLQAQGVTPLEVTDPPWPVSILEEDAELYAPLWGLSVADATARLAATGDYVLYPKGVS